VFRKKFDSGNRIEVSCTELNAVKVYVYDKEKKHDFTEFMDEHEVFDLIMEMLDDVNLTPEHLQLLRETIL
jgi:hypothetical protein